MIIYNVTVTVENDVKEAWLKWMREVHIPEVLATGIFTENRILKVLADADSGGTSYAVQYSCKDMADYEKYRDQFAPALQKAALDKFKDKFVAFRTLLETV
ncbi:MAG: DUF4286 family protein [Bacteroidetes bacterium]|nr:DUF4286 family protein [Bacteroidota bacterium]